MGKDLSGKELGKGICQRKSGMYAARFVNRFGVRQSLYDHDLKKLKKKLKEEVVNDYSHKNIKEYFTLDEWYAKWMEVYKYQIRESSKLHYKRVYEKHISPVIGKKPLQQITTLDITSIINDLDKNGYMYETKNKVKIIMLDMFNKAMIDDFVLKNPAKPIKVERDEYRERRVLSKEEQTDFFDACKGTFYEELFTVAVLTGLRPGEICALRWQDIDLEKRTINVTRTLLYAKLEDEQNKKFHIDPPKTKASIRAVKFDERCEKALKSQFSKKSVISMKKTSKPLPGLEDLLFVTKYNTPINSPIYCAAIKRIVEIINESRSEIEQFEIFSGHCFRHTYATRCFEANVDPKVVQKQLGHANLKMTMDLYTHLFEDKRDDELDKFYSMSDDVFEGSDELAERRYQESLHPKIINL